MTWQHAEAFDSLVQHVMPPSTLVEDVRPYVMVAYWELPRDRQRQLLAKRWGGEDGTRWTTGRIAKAFRISSKRIGKILPQAEADLRDRVIYHFVRDRLPHRIATADYASIPIQVLWLSREGKTLVRKLNIATIEDLYCKAMQLIYSRNCGVRTIETLNNQLTELHLPLLVNPYLFW